MPLKTGFAAVAIAALAVNTAAQTEPASPAGDDARERVLKTGEPAPPLTIETWVKGEPVTEFKKGSIYVVEFWATWCSPCVAAIPHLTHLQQEHKDKVRIIGVSSSNEALDTVKTFVEQQGHKIDYTVAHDADRSMAAAWMKPAGRTGIPCSFVIDREGRIAWIGHPRVGLDAVLSKLVAGSFDAAAWATVEAKANEFRKAAFEAGKNEDYDAAAKALDSLASLDPAFAADAGIMKFRMLLMQKKDYPAAYAVANSLFNGPLKADVDSLAEIAWTILDAPDIEVRDIDLARKFAERAVELDNGENAAILDTLARACWDKGEKDKAIEWQRRAIAKATNQNHRQELEATLARYEGR